MTSADLRPQPHQQLYGTDFIQWVNQTADLLKQGKFDELDLVHLIDEVEDLGRSQKHALESNLRVILMHLLKWQYQPSKRSGSWKGSIREHRKRLQTAFRDSPSLKNYYNSVREDSYTTARKITADETGLPLTTFPKACPYTEAQILNEDCLPEPL